MKLFIMLVLASTLLQCPDDPYCRQCKVENDVNKCKMCQYSVLDTKTDQCKTDGVNIANCLSYIDTNKEFCVECDIGYGIKSDNTCMKCPDNCADCNETGCTSCMDGTMHEDYSCNGQGKACSDSNCIVCDFTDTCKQCKEGFSIGKDSKCSIGIKNCLKLDENDKCEVCNAGYYITDKNECVIFEAPTAKFGYFFYFFILIILGICAYGAYYLYNRRYNENFIPRMQEEYVGVE